MKTVIIVSPSLDATQNVSGISTVVNFIIEHNKEYNYIHFLQGKSDGEKGGVYRLIRILTAYRRWEFFLKQNPGAIVHYNFPLDAFSIIRDYFFMRKCIKQGRRIIVHLHGGLFLFKEKTPFILNYLLKTIFSWNIPYVVQSKKEKERLQVDYNSSKVYVLPNCIDLSAVSMFTRDNYKEGIHVLYLGRIEPNKGIDFLYEAARKLKTEGIGFVLHLAGIEQKGYHCIERFQSLLENQFHYEGVVSGKQKTDLLRLCNVFVLPSFYEGLPMSLLECMSYGMIPVTTNVGSIGDFVIDGVTGLFVRIKDVESIVEALTRLSESSDLRNQLSKGAREKIFTTLDPEKYVDNLNNIYEWAGRCT